MTREHFEMLICNTHSNTYTDNSPMVMRDR